MSEDGVAKPDTIQAAIDMPDVTITMKPHLWIAWASIAIRQEQRAWRLRSKGSQQADFGPYLGQETHEAMQAVVAARSAIHNLFRVLETLLGVNQKKVRPELFTFAQLPKDWNERVTALIAVRDGIVHHDEENAPTQPHPGYPTEIPHLAAAFTAERATEAVEMMLNDVFRPAITAPSAALTNWASDFLSVPDNLDQLRSSSADLL
jgi:hypothetical protein